MGLLHRGDDAHRTDMGGPSYVHMVSCTPDLQPGPANQRRANNSARSPACSNPWIGVNRNSIDHFVQTIGLQRVGEAEAADRQIRGRSAATVQLVVDVLALGQRRPDGSIASSSASWR